MNRVMNNWVFPRIGILVTDKEKYKGLKKGEKSTLVEIDHSLLVSSV